MQDQLINGKAFLTEKELATHLSMSVSWVQKCRYEGTGVRVSKLGRSVRYSVADIQNYKNSLQLHEEL